MDGIDPAIHSELLRSQKEKKKKIDKKGKTKKTSFGDLVESDSAQSASRSSINDSGADLSQLLDSVYSVGEKLKKDPTLRYLKPYKKAVRDFLSRVIREGLDVEENISGVNILKRKRYYVINVVNEKLERLASAVLREQAEQLEILQKVDEIHGILIDLMS